MFMNISNNSIYSSCILYSDLSDKIHLYPLVLFIHSLQAIYFHLKISAKLILYLLFQVNLSNTCSLNSFSM